MTQQQVLEKCAAALGVEAADLGHKVNLAVTAVNEDLQVRQMIQTPLGRRSIVCPLTREEFDLVRQYSDHVRKQERRPGGKYFSKGERPDLLRDTGQRVSDPSPDCNRYYLCKAID